MPQVPDSRDPVDAAFARFARRADPHALAEVFDATAPELLRVAAHLTGRTDAAEDVVQATFLAAIEDRRSWDPAEPVLPWLLGILANRVRRLRRDQRRSVDPAGRHEREVRGPDALAQDQELTESVIAALATLPEVYRPVLNLHLRHGLTAQEIAQSLDRPAGTVRTQVVRGLDLLRRALPKSLALGVAVSAGALG